MKRLLLHGLLSCMVLGQAFAIQDDADQLVIVEQTSVDTEALNPQLEQLDDEMLQEATTKTAVEPEAAIEQAEIEKNDTAQEEHEIAKVTEEIAEPVVIDRGSILEGCKKSFFNAPLGLAISCAAIVASPILGRLLRLVDTHYVSDVVIVSLISTVLLSPIVAPLWTVPAACKAGKYREAVGSILATPFLAPASFIAMSKFGDLVIEIVV
jgi:hypothetical protein